MRINNIVYFSPSLKMEDLDLTDQGQVITYFEERIKEYYFKPIDLLVKAKMAFAAGALECLLIDAFARYGSHENGSEARMVDLLMNHLGLDKTTSTNFYKFFRCGLLHESHIKQYGQFCFDDNYISKAIAEVQGYLIVNPKYLLLDLEGYFQTFLKALTSDATLYKIFISRLTLDFEDEVKLAQ